MLRTRRLPATFCAFGGSSIRAFRRVSQDQKEPPLHYPSPPVEERGTAREFVDKSRLKGARGFSLIELLVTIAVIGVLVALLLPSLWRSKAEAQRVECTSNLRQLSLATQMYWDDNSGACFRWEWGVTNGGRLYWFGWLQDGAEGQRAFDPKPGVLYPYLHEHSVGICPALNYYMAQFKLKATGAAYGYGYNLFLSAQASQSPWKVFALRTSQVALFADAAQINDFQAPASKTNPMLEEWYYVDTTSNYPNGHFRHNQKANTAFCDGHVGPEQMVPGSLDVRLPQQVVGRLRDEILLVH